MRRIAVLLALLGMMIMWAPGGIVSAQDLSNEVETQVSRDAKVPAKKIDLNLAGPDEIGRLPGITPQAAERIFRNRPYKKMDDLITRKVIGKKQFAQIREHIVIGSGQK